MQVSSPFPKTLLISKVKVKAIKPLHEPKLGNASIDDINYLAQAIKNAVLPVFLLGSGSSSASVTHAIRELLQYVNIPVVETFQGAGVDWVWFWFIISSVVLVFSGINQAISPKKSDLIIAIGYDPIEYEARNWNAEIDSRVIVIDKALAEIDTYYQPERELDWWYCTDFGEFDSSDSGLQDSRRQRWIFRWAAWSPV